jgi:dual specificity tyrosine-phosphorylation-regulated kinase 2/3/4
LTQTLNYRAPEVSFQRGFGPEADMWSLGCILFELYTGRQLFIANTEEDLFSEYQRYLGDPPSEMMSNHYKNIMMKHTHMIVEQSLEEAFFEAKGPDHSKSQAFRNLFDFTSKCLTYDPKKRMTPEQAKLHPFLTRDNPRPRRTPRDPRRAGVTKPRGNRMMRTARL